MNTAEFIAYCNIGPYILNDETSLEHFLPYERAIYCVQVYYQKKLTPKKYQELVDRVEKLKIVPPKSKSTQKITISKINIDEFMVLMIENYHLLKMALNENYFHQTEFDFCEFEEFSRNLKEIRGLRIGDEEIQNGFTNYSDIIKKDDEEIVRAISRENLLSFGVDNEIVNFELLLQSI